mgnify:CR=1 FL=1
MTTISIDPKNRDLLKITSATHGIKLQDLTNKMVEKVLNNEARKQEIITEIKLGLEQNKNGNTGSI